MPEIKLDSEIIAIARAISNAGGKALLIGGSVRDFLLQDPIPQDLDIEVYHLSPSRLESVLTTFGHVAAVGKHFGIFKLSTSRNEYDFSLPRTENKSGPGHKGFMIDVDPNMNFASAAARRDFTINAMGYDILTGKIYDSFQGRLDLQQGTLRHIGPAFTEDPLRVLRAMQFAARFELKIAPETLKICQNLDLQELPKERLFEEFKKLFLKAKFPSIGLKAALDLGVLKFFPELRALIGVPQDPVWHPEGDVWTHTLMVMDESAKLRQNDEKKDIRLMFGALCHDFGKPATTVFKEGHWRSPAHDVKGLEPTESFLRRLSDEQILIESVKIYVREHLKPALLYQARTRVTDGAIRRLAMRVPIPELIRVATADHFGRTTQEALARVFPARDWLLERAEALDVKDNAPHPILKGRHLLKLGMTPGPLVGQLIRESFELQLDGKLNQLQDAIRWAETRLKTAADFQEHDSL